MSTGSTEPRTATPIARDLVLLLAGMIAHTRELVIAPPSDSYPLWSASLRLGGHSLGEDAAWAGRTGPTGGEMDYDIEAEDLGGLVSALVGRCSTASARPSAELRRDAITLEELLTTLHAAGRQLTLSAPLESDAGGTLGVLLQRIADSDGDGIPVS